jgi:hypothetical protein
MQILNWNPENLGAIDRSFRTPWCIALAFGELGVIKLFMA